MHALLELLPLIGLVAGFFLGKSIDPDEGMYYLSYGAILGTLLQFFIYKWRNQRMQKTTLITGIVLILFAIITIILRNKLFIMIKPTVLSWGFALFFWGYAFFKKQSVLELMIGKQFTLPASKWIQLNWGWVIFNLLVGLVNLLVVWKIRQGQWSDSSWLIFKGVLLPLSIVFIVGQTAFLFKYGTMKDTKSSDRQEM